MSDVFIRDSTWALIRDQFSEQDKDELFRAQVGEIICPRGCTVEAAKLSEDLRTRLHAALKGGRR